MPGTCDGASEGDGVDEGVTGTGAASPGCGGDEADGGDGGTSESAAAGMPAAPSSAATPAVPCKGVGVLAVSGVRREGVSELRAPCTAQ